MVVGASGRSGKRDKHLGCSKKKKKILRRSLLEHDTVSSPIFRRIWSLCLSSLQNILAGPWLTTLA